MNSKRLCMVVVVVISSLMTEGGSKIIVEFQNENVAMSVTPSVEQDLLKVRLLLEKYKSVVRKKLQAQNSPFQIGNELAPVKEEKSQILFEFDNDLQQSLEPEEFMKVPEIPRINRHLNEYLYQGDMALTANQAEQMFQEIDDKSGDGKRLRRQALNLHNNLESRWGKTISYYFGKDIATKRRALIRKAMDFWTSHTCLAFQEKSFDDPDHKLHFYNGSGCFSYVGRISEWTSQPISIGDGCEHMGVIAHEIAHALGFFHSQSRYDRDRYVRFNIENVAKGFEDQFDKESSESNNNYNIPYDYGSVMHYSDVACSKADDEPVLVANEAHNQNTMGQRMQPSFNDVLVMNKHYDCLGCPQNSKTANCVNDGYPHPRNCSRCICPWGFGGDLCDMRQASTTGEQCGATLKATRQWQDLRGTLGEASKVVRPNYSSCHWHIVAPEGYRVRLQIIKIGRVCSAGCFYGNVEFKISEDFGKTGIRMCCSKDLDPEGAVELKSETRLAVINLYSNFFIQNFHVRFKIDV